MSEAAPPQAKSGAAVFSTPRFTLAILIATLVLAAVLLFTRLGHYALWDDESYTALGARGVLRTGDTSILLDHGNIVACRGGLLVTNMCDRATPPLPAYLVAASFALFGQDTWTARLPFALAGLGTIALVLLWARRQGWLFMAVTALGLLGNVSLLLFCRQCRYYALAIFFSTAIVLLYSRAKWTPRNLFTLSLLSALLFASQYLDYFALYACLALDYAVWKRHESPLGWRGALWLFLPQAILNGIVGAIWNPLLTPFDSYATHVTFLDHFTLFYRYWRDVDFSEFVSLPLLLVTLIVGLNQRRTWLVRGCGALAVYLTMMALLCEQPPNASVVADTRYVIPIIPLAIVLEAALVCLASRHRPALALAAALFVFFTNTLFFVSVAGNSLRSTPASFVRELINPVPEPITPTADWIAAHVPDGASVWVEPDYLAYPLMFRAPNALYAWQLAWPPLPNFASLPRIHFHLQEPPDYIIAFAPSVPAVNRLVTDWRGNGLLYKWTATIPVFWRPLYRPELFWHSFTPVPTYNPKTQSVYIYARVKTPRNP